MTTTIRSGQRFLATKIDFLSRTIQGSFDEVKQALGRIEASINDLRIRSELNWEKMLRSHRELSGQLDNIVRLVAGSSQRLYLAELETHFGRCQSYLNGSIEDISRRDIQDLSGALLDTWADLKVYNPLLTGAELLKVRRNSRNKATWDLTVLNGVDAASAVQYVASLLKTHLGRHSGLHVVSTVNLNGLFNPNCFMNVVDSYDALMTQFLSHESDAGLSRLDALHEDARRNHDFLTNLRAQNVINLLYAEAAQCLEGISHLINERYNQVVLVNRAGRRMQQDPVVLISNVKRMSNDRVARTLEKYPVYNFGRSGAVNMRKTPFRGEAGPYTVGNYILHNWRRADKERYPNGNAKGYTGNFTRLRKDYVITGPARWASIDKYTKAINIPRLYILAHELGIGELYGGMYGGTVYEPAHHLFEDRFSHRKDLRHYVFSVTKRYMVFEQNRRVTVVVRMDGCESSSIIGVNRPAMDHAMRGSEVYQDFIKLKPHQNFYYIKDREGKWGMCKAFCHLLTHHPGRFEVVDAAEHAKRLMRKRSGAGRHKDFFRRLLKTPGGILYLRDNFECKGVIDRVGVLEDFFANQSDIERQIREHLYHMFYRHAIKALLEGRMRGDRKIFSDLLNKYSVLVALIRAVSTLTGANFTAHRGQTALSVLPSADSILKLLRASRIRSIERERNFHRQHGEAFQVISKRMSSWSKTLLASDLEYNETLANRLSGVMADLRKIKAHHPTAVLLDSTKEATQDHVRASNRRRPRATVAGAFSTATVTAAAAANGRLDTRTRPVATEAMVLYRRRNARLAELGKALFWEHQFPQFP